MDSKCSQLLPSVCTVLADSRQPVSDDTCLEKLLDWFKMLTNNGSGLLLLEENPCLTELILTVLRQEEPNPTILSFVLRLAGLLAASESSFQHLQQGEAVRMAFGEAGPLSSALWEDTSVRSGWVQGAHDMLQHPSAFRFLCDSGALDTIFTLQGDRSLFVASAANRLLACMLRFSVQSGHSCPLGTGDSEWPECARRIVSRLEESLRSHSASRANCSLKMLTTVFEQTQEAWTEVLWSSIDGTIKSLLEEESAQAGHSLVDLFLSMARSPVFSCHEGSLWQLVTLALKCLHPTQAGFLALGLLKLEECPQAVKTQGLRILLQPVACVARASSHSSELSGLLDQPPAEGASVESLLSSRSSCISLLCQSLAHLEEIQHLAHPPMDFPHNPLLHATVTVLRVCAGLAVPTCTLGATIGKILIGCSRVQRAALHLLGALSRWANRDVSPEETFDILLVYLRSPDASPTVLKTAFQVTLKWCLSFSETSGSTDGFPWHKQFLRDLMPLLQKRLCSPRWEVRDSTLEFLTLVMKHLKGQEWFRQALSSSEVMALAEGLLDDPESYVRASAVRALGQSSLIASAGSEVPGLDHNGSSNEDSVAARLLGILSSDSEGFPRRAVVGVFIDWLREGHPAARQDPEQFVSQVIQAVKGDLDWEVKVSGLELAGAFAAQCFHRFGFPECPYAADVSSAGEPARLPELLQVFSRVRLFDFLFGALGDCDRPVALKACEILTGVKGKIGTGCGLNEGQGLERQGNASLEEIWKMVAPCASGPLGGDRSRTIPQDPKRALLILEAVDLEELEGALGRSSDHLEKSPWSLLQDILSAGGAPEDNEADCY
ncbi:PREDICTED: BRCA1-associated ATM activator 1 [Gekko japonicus]|uniref:BRCA1-associated ATM activator 1 n=1 Tax=Gekko japonicus TaxID=146911 RepID=A0ABM1KKC8_GEKJA|nr:PREDICTED: BRCA1-associated ATM activator 1 [Gekko japonicus]